MEDPRFDIMAPRDRQLEVLVSYLEKAAKGYEGALPWTLRTAVLVQRYLWEWRGLWTKEGITAKGAFLYYLRIR